MKRIGFIAMSGVRAHNPELTKLGLTLPGFVERNRVIASLPSNSAFVVDRMTFEDASFELEGHATSLQDVDSIAKSARAAGMDVSPPQSRREDDGRWSFTIRGGKLSATAFVPTEAR